MKIIFLGAPGAGKGTQSAIVQKRFGIPGISTGDIIRDNLKSDSDSGKLLKSYIEKGQLVPDEIVIDIVKKRISESDCSNGFILDGFPRTIAQAKALESMGVHIDKVINLVTPDDVIYKRMSGRRVCENCQAVYNINNFERMPKVMGICDKCSGKLVTRKDDDLDTVKERLKVYYNETSPLIDYYKGLNKLSEIDASNPLERITADVFSILEAIS